MEVSDDVSSPDDLDVSILLGGVSRTAAYDAGSGLWRADIDAATVADGSQMLEARATDAAGNTASISHDVTVESTADPAPALDGLVISAVTSGTVESGRDWTGWVEPTVTDGGTPAEGITVSATWTGGSKHGSSGTVWCVTDSAGQCRLSASQPKRVPSITFDAGEPSAVSVTVPKP